MIGRWLIAIGVVLVVVGLLWPWLGKLGLGRLPGDIVIERGAFHFYFPIVRRYVKPLKTQRIRILVSGIPGALKSIKTRKICCRARIMQAQF